MEEHAFTIVGFIGSIITVAAFIAQLRSDRESIKVYILLFLVVALSGVTAFSLANSMSVKARNVALNKSIDATNNTLSIINDVMQDVEVFNSLQALPSGQEDEYISKFENNIREAASKLRSLKSEIQNQIDNGS